MFFTHYQLVDFMTNGMGFPEEELLGFVEVPHRKIYKAIDRNYKVIAILPYKEIEKYLMTND